MTGGATTAVSMETRSPVGMAGLLGSVMLKSGLPVSVSLGRFEYSSDHLAFSSCSACVFAVCSSPPRQPALLPWSCLPFQTFPEQTRLSALRRPPACLFSLRCPCGRLVASVQQQSEHLWLSEKAAAADFCRSPVLLAWALALSSGCCCEAENQDDLATLRQISVAAQNRHILLARVIFFVLLFLQNGSFNSSLSYAAHVDRLVSGCSSGLCSRVWLLSGLIALPGDVRRTSWRRGCSLDFVCR